ncbi:MAG: hypothetical protein R2685_04810 [Candidatus Nitrosocosmicus sp.]|nr:hypothetical protein [Candidatus Nitrosocosmicus sp.]
MKEIINKNYNKWRVFVYYLLFDMDELIEEFLLYRVLNEQEVEEEEGRGRGE